MSTTAKLSRLSFAFLLLNVVLVVVVAALRPVFATQTGDARSSDPPVVPDVQVPGADEPKGVVILRNDDAPSLPISSSLPLQDVNSGEIQTLPLDGKPPNATDAGPPNRMVLDEIRKLIQEGRADTDIPPISFPVLPLKTSASATPENLSALSHRMRSIASLTQSAQTLIQEAEYLQAQGQTSEAMELINQVRALRAFVAQLSGSKGSDHVPDRTSN